VDRAESEPQLAHTINATAPGVLARAAAARGALLVHYSTDYVFDGSGAHARTEDAPTGPLSVYGRSKLAGEQAVRENAGRHLILRTSWVYGARGQNFPKTMLRLAQERAELRVIDDQVGAPTGADLLADVTAHALRVMQAQPAVAGTYHVAAAGETSWHGLAGFAIDTARALRPELPWRVERIEPIPTADYPTPARRPLNSRLDTTRVQAAFGLQMPPWQAGVRRMLTEFLTPS
jgi:dTDP-4-dehydrorhamnose reductase